ncbi:hypothetical protein ACRRTK_018022 [Alexandromys fortis]
MAPHSRPYFLWLCVLLLPDWHCEEKVLGKHPASLLPIVCGVDTMLTLTGTGKSACHSLCCSHSSACLTTATQMLAPKLKGDHGTVLLGLLIGDRE